MKNPRVQQLIDQDSVTVRLLRDQALACACCGDLFSAGDQVILPRVEAEALIAIGDAEMLIDYYTPPEARR
jgi:hypothetical protein